MLGPKVDSVVTDLSVLHILAIIRLDIDVLGVVRVRRVSEVLICWNQLGFPDRALHTSGSK